MRLLNCCLLIILVVCASCTGIFSSSTKTKLLHDTIVDFSTVDVSPSFSVCDSLIDKNKKSECFRIAIHKKIGDMLLKHQFTSKKSLKEIVNANLLIDKSGKVSIKTLNLSDTLRKALPSLDSILRHCINEFPIIYPAIKRGIPVNTMYTLPIKIDVKH